LSICVISYRMDNDLVIPILIIPWQAVRLQINFDHAGIQINMYNKNVFHKVFHYLVIYCSPTSAVTVHNFGAADATGRGY